MISMPQPQQDALSRMREVLHDDFRALQVESYRLDEDLATDRASILCRIEITPSGRILGIEGTGNGLIDAFFNGARERFSSEFPSLRHLRFTTFRARGLLREARGHAANADAEVEVGVTNSYGTEFLFGSRTSSLSKSALAAVLAAVEYFINAEAAYVTTWKALQHYRSAGRSDLESKYTKLLSELVKNTSYSEVIDALRTEPPSR